MRRVLRGIAVGFALACFLPAVAAAQEPTLQRVLPAAGLAFDVDWTNGEYFTANNTTVSRFNLATGAPIGSSFSVPSGTINDIDAVTGGVYVATIGLSRVYAYNSNGTGGIFTDPNTQNRLGDVRGMHVAGGNAYLTTGNATLLKVNLSVVGYGYPQIVAGTGINFPTGGSPDAFENCTPNPNYTPGNPATQPACFGSGYSGPEYGKITGAVDVDVRTNVEGTGENAIFILERGTNSPGNEFRVTSFVEGATGIDDTGGVVIGGSPGAGADQFMDPYGLAFDDHPDRSRFYIADQGNHRVAVYGGGEFIQAFGYGVDTGDPNKLESCTLQSGCQAGSPVNLNNPQRVQVDPSNGDVYVSHLGGISQFSFDGEPVKAPKDVLLEARPMRVLKNADTTLTASLLPCAGTEDEPIVFERKDGTNWRRVGFKEANRNCMGKVTTKVTKQTTYRARSRETATFLAGTSPRVTVRLKPPARRR